jgi:predicted 2-oxoglutarate/Fe(II)-dependent dioxygenase YbiX
MYCFIRDFLSEEQVQSIVSSGDSGPLIVNKSIRSVSLNHLELKDDIKWYADHVEELAQNVKFLFKSQYEILLDISGGIEKDSMNYLVYNNSDHYTYHQDLDVNSKKERIRKRVLTVSTQLSDEEDYNGGELILKINDNEIVSPKHKGSAVVFLSDTPHKVNAVTSGTRKSAVTWFHSE